MDSSLGRNWPWVRPSEMSRCPICKRYMGLHDKSGRLVACETHDHDYHYKALAKWRDAIGGLQHE